MDISAAILTIGEIALGLAGFSSVLVALSGQPSRWSALDSFRISAMLTASLGALLLSLLPFVIRFLGVDPPLAWRYSAGLAAMVFGFWLVRNPSKYLRLPPADRATVRPMLMWSFQSALSLVAAALAGAAFGMVDHADGVYLLSLYCLVGSSCYLIVRFLFARPRA